MKGQKSFLTIVILSFFLFVGIVFINAYPVIGRSADEVLLPLVVFLVISALVVNAAIFLVWRYVK